MVSKENIKKGENMSFIDLDSVGSTLTKDLKVFPIDITEAPTTASEADEMMGVHLYDVDGEWFKAAGDLTFMWPMLEMSGERFRYIEHGLYVYNESNENSDFRKVPHEQRRIQEMLKQREPYKRLDNL